MRISLNKRALVAVLLVLIILFIIYVKFNERHERNDDSKSDVRIFCIVKTHPDNIRSNKTSTTFKIWVHKCTNYRFISLIPDELKPSRRKSNEDDELEIDKPFRILQPRYHKNESHDYLSLKVYHSIISIYERFGSYDWYYLVDDDAYCNMNNMRLFLKDKSADRPVTYGFIFHAFMEGGYHSGGPGYLISNKAFVKLGDRLKQSVRLCNNTGLDDYDVNYCLRSLGTRIETAVDQHGRQRFLSIDLLNTFYGRFPDWLKQYSPTELKSDFECCSDSLIAMHYTQPEEMIRYEIAYELQKNIADMYKMHSNNLDHVRRFEKLTFKHWFKIYILLKNLENE